MDLDRWLAPRLTPLDAALAAATSDAWPDRFLEAVRYPLFTGGKRVRPALVFAAFDAVVPDADPGPAVAAAAAVELVHTYSLVHDDLPAMDDDDVRRGRPTVHKVYGDGPAVLVGDALLTEAFAVLARAPGLPAASRIAMVEALADAAGHRGMIGGQAADIGLGGPVVELEALSRLHAGKTGALIRAAAVLGALAAGAGGPTLDRLAAYGRAIGVAFQLADDVLDADEDAEGAVPSFVRLLGVDETRRRAQLLADEAIAQVLPLPRSEVLVALARFVVDRTV